MRSRTVIGMAAFALMAVMLMPGMAEAEKPETRTTTIDNQGVVIENYCGDGVDVEFGSVGEFRSSDFFDSDGVLIRTQGQATLEVKVSLSTTEEVLEGQARYRVNIDAATGQRDFTGLLFRINVPGQGGVYRDIGNQVFDSSNEQIFVAGQNAPTNSLDFACDFLG